MLISRRADPCLTLKIIIRMSKDLRADVASASRETDGAGAAASCHMPDTLRQVRRPALIVAHPGHELLVYGWMAQARPVLHILTDGSRRAGQGRIAASHALARGMGVRPGGIFGTIPDAAFYHALLEQRHDFFLSLLDELANALARDDVDALVGDARDGYCPIHDLCRAMIDACAVMLRAETGKPVLNLAFELAEWEMTPARAAAKTGLDVVLGDDLFAAKLAAARRYRGMEDEVQAALAARGPDFFRVERFLPPAQPSDAAPYYDHNARQLLARGRIGQAINHRDHVAPVLDAIARHAAAAPLRAQAG